METVIGIVFVCIFKEILAGPVLLSTFKNHIICIFFSDESDYNSHASIKISYCDAWFVDFSILNIAASLVTEYWKKNA